ncbi:phosphate ABC transporter permease PstA [Porphyromonas levii]|uniref:phosphate ABC transporter permease PstA n=1 Tax=Porphyromonas levii TaxID=28114 RepID=UPI00035EF0A8|nr:phosphate ABC transporter permease PstA [Porphyromonas levii]MBR8703423.1 Phosphate transport system permease protein PstA [Porphyromonas levii]MBR8712605.1 Phosphate transport system permease protein PstA [Porphyromonas levii]MBR8714597.1 Phosphate transport system permease protein PstA [Porphyromonas levii]MBR8727122.1 Phosphate transport system permease protein PstA [Porphyromonas levii]MBR8731628.1 Phosphate transport system permease protein PstA [Porphyromonas levii]
MSKINIDTISKRSGNLKRRGALSKGVFFAVILLSVLTAVPLLFILLDLILKGWKQFNFSLFTEVVPTSMEAMFARQTGDIIPGGILNGITGTLVMLGIAMVLSIPIGLFGGIYLSEKKGTKMANIVRTLTDILQGIPSIVWGIVVYMLVVKAMNSYSALSGGIALGLMMIPMIIRSTEEGLLMIPSTYKEAGLALGGSYTSVMFKVIIPSAFGSLFTGILLAVSRVMGETAPLMVTALGATYVHWDISQPMSAISLLIWEFYNDPNLADLVWSSSLLLLLLILSMNLLAKSIAAKWRI